MANVLVATSVEAYPTLRELLREVPADYATSFAGAVEALLERRYSQVLVDLRFEETRALELARRVREQAPAARVICINAMDEPLTSADRARIDERLRLIGYEGLIDLARGFAGNERRRALRDRRAQPRPGSVDRRREPAPAL